MDTKEKLTTILQEVISKGRSGSRGQIKALTAILSEQNFDKTIRQKIQIFQNVPEESKMFSIIYDTAKKCLADLKVGKINIHAFELVKLFYTLDENFKRKLFPVNFVDSQHEKEIDNEIMQQQNFCDEVKEKINIKKEEKIIELPEGVTGIKFLSAKILDQKSFNDLSQALENL